MKIELYSKYHIEGMAQIDGPYALVAEWQEDTLVFIVISY